MQMPYNSPTMAIYAKDSKSSTHMGATARTQFLARITAQEHARDIFMICLIP